MTDKINKLISLAEKAKANGQYNLALKYLNLAIELAEQAKDEQAVLKCLALIREITGYLSEEKEKLSKKTKYSFEKQVEKSSFLSGLIGFGDKRESSSEITEIAEKSKADDWEATTEKERIIETIKHQMSHLEDALSMAPPSFKFVPGAPAKEEQKKQKKKEEAGPKKSKPAKPSPPKGAGPPMPAPIGDISRPPSRPPGGPPSSPPPPPPAGGMPVSTTPSTPADKPEPKTPAVTIPPPPSLPSAQPAPRPSPPAEPAPIARQPAREEIIDDRKSEEPAEEVMLEEDEDAYADIPESSGLRRAVRGRIPITGEEGEAKPKKIKRFGDVSAPMEMTEKKEYLINIGLRVFKEDVVGMPVPMTITVPTAGPPIVEVLVLGQDFKVDQPRRSLIVPLDHDSDILNFRVTPQKDGIRSITVEFYQEGTLIGRAILKIVVKKKKEPVNENLSSTSVTVASRFGETRLDATLRIVRYGDDFFFSLFTPRAKAVVSQSALFGKATVDMGKVHKLEVAMEDAVFDRDSTQAALERLKALGAQIYNYIPKQIRKTITSIEPKYLMIETGDLLIPWELGFDGDDFLCSKYCLGKRVFDETRDFRPPPFCIGKKALDVIFIGASPKDVPEISVKEELDLFDTYEQTKRIHLQRLIEPDAVKAKVIEVLNQGDVVHFTCHGKFDEKDPIESALLLSDDILTADEIDDMEWSNWPLIFANACSTGAISEKIVGVGGIARSFLEAGAIAFLGPLFEIPDDIAIEFAKEFYNNLLFNDENIGEAIRNTRQKLRDQFGGAFWAIFSLYGDPTLSLCKA